MAPARRAMCSTSRVPRLGLGLPPPALPPRLSLPRPCSAGSAPRPRPGAAPSRAGAAHALGRACSGAGRGPGLGPLAAASPQECERRARTGEPGASTGAIRDGRSACGEGRSQLLATPRFGGAGPWADALAAGPPCMLAPLASHPGAAARVRRAGCGDGRSRPSKPCTPVALGPPAKGPRPAATARLPSSSSDASAAHPMRVGEPWPRGGGCARRSHAPRGQSGGRLGLQSGLEGLGTECCCILTPKSDGATFTAGASCGGSSAPSGRAPRSAPPSGLPFINSLKSSPAPEAGVL